LVAIYPEHNFKVWKFNHVPHQFWKDTTQQRELFDRIAGELNITTLDDWKRVRVVDAVARGAGSAITGYHNGSLIKGIYSKLV
jgi:hypothetical protein